MLTEEPLLQSLAITGAFTPALLAGIALTFSRHRDSAPGLLWWVAALVVESLRLVLISFAGNVSPTHIALANQFAHTVFAFLVLAGVLQYFGGNRYSRRAVVGFAVVTIFFAITIADPNTIGPIFVIMAITAATAFAVTAWMFWRSHISSGKPGYVTVAVLSAIFCLAMAANGLSAVNGGWPITLNHDSWYLNRFVVPLGLSIATIVSLIFVTQWRLYRGNVQSGDRANEVLQTFFENMEDGITVIDADLNIVAHNDRFLELLDLPAKLLEEGATFQKICRFNAERHEYGPGNVEDIVRKRIKLTKRFEPHHMQRVRPNGTVLEIHGNPLPGGGFVTTYSDITERKRAEDLLRDGELRFRDIAEVSGDWVWEMDSNLRFTYLSQRFEQVIAQTSKVVIGKTRRDLLAGDPDNPAWRQHLEDLDARRSFRNFEYIFRAAADGTPHHLRISGKPVFDAYGKFQGYRGTGTDITAEVEAKVRAAHLEQRLRDAIESLPHGVALFDSNDCLVFCNSKHKDIYPEAGDLMVPGRKFEEIFRAACARDLYPMDKNALDKFIEERLSFHRDPVDKPQEQRLRDDRWVQVNERKTAEGGTITSWTDITRLKRREQALAILVEASTGGGPFLEASTRALAIGLGYRWAGVCRHRGNGLAEILALWNGDGYAKPYTYALEGTPCGAAFEAKGFTYFSERVSEQFPDDSALTNMGVETYLADLLEDTGGNISGHVFAMNDTPDPSAAQNRELVGLIANWVNIELRQREAEQARAESDARFRDIAEVAGDWIWEMDADLRVIYISDRFETSTGMKKSDLLGKTRIEAVRANGDDESVILNNPKWRQHLADLAAKKPFRDFTYNVKANDGRICHFRVSGKPVFDDTGEFKGYRGTGADITAIVKAQAEADQNAKLIQVVFDNMAEGISIADADLKMVGYNRRFLELLNFPPELFEGETTFEEVIRFNAERHEYGPGDVEEQVRERVELAKKFEPHDIERTLPNGTVIEIRGNPLPGGGFVSTYTDITERKRAEEALRNSQARLANAQRIAQMGNWNWNLLTDEVQWSKETYKIFGMEKDDFDGVYDSFLNTVHPNDRKFVEDAAQRAIAGDEPYSIDHRIILPSGEVRYVHEQAEIEYGDNGNPLEFSGTVQDISERKEAEAAVQDNELRIRTIMENVADGLITAEESGMISSVNPAAEQLFGYTAKELIGKNVSVLMPSPDAEAHDGYINGYLKSKTASVIGIGPREVTGMRKGGSTFPMDLAISEIWLGDRHVFIGSARDITARKEAEQQLRQAKETAELANRTKGEFLATMSHELRTPLNAIIGFSEVMSQELFGELGHDNYRDYAHDIWSSGTHLLDIINDILDVSKAEAGMIDLTEETVELPKVMESCLRLVRPRAEENSVRLKTDIPRQIAKIRGDARRLKQILLNLLANAVKFTPAGGEVIIKVRADQENGILMQVIDNGMGISDEDLDRVMEPFTQADSTFSRTHEGTGLGLPLTRALTELHGGALTMESRLGKGTIVSITLPRERIIGKADAA